VKDPIQGQVPALGELLKQVRAFLSLREANALKNQFDPREGRGPAILGVT
jgi:hypothetical protein